MSAATKSGSMSARLVARVAALAVSLAGCAEPSLLDGGVGVADASGEHDAAVVADRLTDASAPSDAGEIADATTRVDAALGSRCEQTEARIVCAHHTTSIAGEGDLPREVHWQVPLGDAPPDGWPVVFLFQASFVSAEISFRGASVEPVGAYHQAATVAALLDAGFAIIAPETRLDGATYWDTNIPPYTISWDIAGDHRLMRALFDAVEGTTFGDLDPSRMFAAGMSSGGFMTSRMAVSYPGRFRALAIASAGYATCSALCVLPDTLPADHPPTLFLHGERDLVVPINVMRMYDEALRGQGTTTRVVVDPDARHAWIEPAPTEIAGWFLAHDRGR